MIGNGKTESVRNSDNLKRFEDLVANVLEGRAGILRQLTDPRRDIDGECGYPVGDGIGVGGLNSELYRLMYEREAVANRVVQVYPKESWQVTPLVYEDEDPAISTEFEAAWDALGQDLRGEQCWYQDEKGSPVWEQLKRADILSGIGHFGVLLLAFDDGLPLDQPLELVAREEVTPEGERVVNLAHSVRRNYSLYRTAPNGVIRNCGLRVVNVSTETRRYPTRPSKEVEAAPIYGSDPISGRPTVVGNRAFSIEQGDEPVGGWGTVPGGNPRYSQPTGNAYVASPGPGYVFTGPGTDAQYDGAYWGAGGINTQPGNGYNPLESERVKDQSKEEGAADGTRGQGNGEEDERPGKKEKSPSRRLLFMRAFDESLVQIVQYESDVRNPRFGMPLMYRITLNDPRDMHGGIGLTAATVRVHWSRVIHLADNLGSSEIFGVPRMRPVLNRLLDLRKLYSGSAEMYWRGAFPGLALSTHPTLGGDVEVDKDSIRDTMENYFNGLQRYLMLMGMSAQTLSPQVVDPTSQISLQIEAICIQLGCPIRVFKGSERGELASSQDDAAWNDRLRERQNTYLTPRVIAPLIDRLIAAGVLPQPRGYSIEWPDLTSLSQADKAGLATARAQALGAYTQVQPTGLVGKFDYLTRIIGMEDEEAAAVLQAAEAEAQQAAAQQAAAQAPVPIDPSLVQLVDDGQGNQVPVIDDGQGNQMVVQDDGAGGYTLPAQQAVQLGLAPPEVLQAAGPVPPGTPPGTPPSGAPGAPPPTEHASPGSPSEEVSSDEKDSELPPDDEDEEDDGGDDNSPGSGPRRTAPPGRKLPSAGGRPPLSNTTGPHEYASTQYNLSPRVSKRVSKLAALINEGDLAGEGREDTPHVTVRYGLLSDEPAKALAIATRLGPVHATLGEVKVFSSATKTAGDNSAAGLVSPTDSPDVVYIEVDAPLLHKLNHQLKQAYPHVEKYREYRPHVTLAYVKPGQGAKYAGPCSLTGLSFYLSDFVFSTREGEKSSLREEVANVFCATGEGGGIDPTCRKDSTRRIRAPHHASSVAAGNHSAEALTISQQADKDSRQGGPHARARKAAEDSARAVEAMSRGELEEATALHRRASHSHDDATTEHMWEAGRVTSDQDRERHLQAARAHRQASEAHSSASQEIYQGGRGVNSTEVRRERERASEATEEVTRMLAGMAADMRRPGASSQERELVDVTQQAAVLKDEALDSVDPEEASRLHREVARLHERGSDLAVTARDALRQSNVTLDNNRRIAELDGIGLRHREGQRYHNRAANRLHKLALLDHVSNVFCATGEGGGVDPSCKKGEARQAPPEQHRISVERVRQHAEEAARLSRAAPISDEYKPQVEADLAAASAAADEARQALEQGDAERAMRAHRRAAEEHWTLSQDHDVLSAQSRHNQKAYDAHRQAYDAHGVAAQSHEAMIREINEGGRAATARQLREARAEALTHSSSLAHRAADEPDPALREAAQEAGVLADRAEDAEEVNAAIQAHQEAAGAHRRAENLALQLMYSADQRSDRETARRYRRIMDDHMTAAWSHGHAQTVLRELGYLGHVINVFCATGPGGGVDPSCKKGERRQIDPEGSNTAAHIALDLTDRVHEDTRRLVDQSAEAPYANRLRGALYASERARVRAQEALQESTGLSSAGHHERAMWAHEDAANVLSAIAAQAPPQVSRPLTQLAHQHREAAATHGSAVSESHLGRNEWTRRVQKDRQVAHGKSQKALQASQEAGGGGVSRAEEAAVAADEAYEATDVGQAAHLHSQVAAAHREAADRHNRAEDAIRLERYGSPERREDAELTRRQRLHEEAAYQHRSAWDEHSSASQSLYQMQRVGHVSNVFCATGEGGGIDPTCKRGDSVHESRQRHHVSSRAAGNRSAEATAATRTADPRIGSEGPTGLARKAEDHAARAVAAAARGDEEEARVAHQHAAYAHEEARVEHDWRSRQVASTRERELHRRAAQAQGEAARAHEAAAREIYRGGRGVNVREVQREREYASETTDTALRMLQEISTRDRVDSELSELTQRAAVLKDESLDAVDVRESHRLHTEVASLHHKADELAQEIARRRTILIPTAESNRIVSEYNHLAFLHREAYREHQRVAERLKTMSLLDHVTNVFCATGEGGGIDPSCKKGESRQVDPSGDTRGSHAALETTRAATGVTAPLRQQLGSQNTFASRQATSIYRWTTIAEERAQAAARTTSSDRSVEQHELAAEAHQTATRLLTTLIDELRESNQTSLLAPAQAAQEAHEEAARSQLAAAAEARRGRGHRVTEAQKLREDAHGTSQEALALSARTEAGEGRLLSQEAAVRADEAADAIEIGKAIRLHKEAATLHYRAMRAHQGDRAISQDKFNYGTETEHPRKESHSRAAEAHASAAYVHRNAAEDHERAANHLESLRRTGHVSNVFCPTGKGGGVDPSCKRGESRQADPPEPRPGSHRAHQTTQPLLRRAQELYPPPREDLSGENDMGLYELEGAVEDSARAARAKQPGRARRYHERAINSLDRAFRMLRGDTPERQQLRREIEEAQEVHRAAMIESRHGRHNTARLVQEARSDAGAQSTLALQHMEADAASEVLDLAAEAAVASDRAVEDRHPTTAADLHQQAGNLHYQVATRVTGASRDRHRQAAQLHHQAAERLRDLDRTGHVANVFCATGEGGGVDPSCKRGEARQAPPDNIPLGHVPALRLGDEAMGFAARQLHEAGGHAPVRQARAVIVEGRRAWNRVVRAYGSGDRGRLLMAQQEMSLVYERMASALQEVARRGPPNTADLYQAVHQIEQARAQVQFASDELRSGGRGQTELELQRQRQRAGEASLNAREASANANDPVGARRTDEASIASDEAADERVTERAAELHRRAAEAHGAAAVHYHERFFEGGRNRDVYHEAAQAHELAQQEHASAARRLAAAHRAGYALNVFCATGQGGGIDPSCSKENRGMARQSPPQERARGQRVLDAWKAAEEAAGALEGEAGQRVRDQLTRLRRMAKKARSERKRYEEADLYRDIQGESYALQRTLQEMPAGAARQAVADRFREARRTTESAYTETQIGRRATVRQAEEAVAQAQQQSVDALRRTEQLGIRSLRARKPAQEAAVAADRAFDTRLIEAAIPVHREAAQSHEETVRLLRRYVQKYPHQAIAKKVHEVIEAHDKAANRHRHAADVLSRMHHTGHVTNMPPREEQTP